ncbi:MAG: mannose-1-phosphate guanylyltransferase [Pseudohongiellaceae bacterium]|jgi:mannose-1-phosphate guanylyltransferase
MIIPVIMAGGTGSRLWPVSRESFPKQFVSFQDNKPSLFQQALQRLEGIDGLQAPIVLCSDNSRFLVVEQLDAIGIGNANIILEPVSRNTAPAVALAALSAREKSPDALLLVLAADHLIENIDAFHKAIAIAAENASSGKLATFGVPPNRPETGYGYIKRAENLGLAFAVESFVEKPNLAKAQEYIASSEYYWNSGMFMFSAATYLAELEAFTPKIYNCCIDAYSAASIDTKFGFTRLSTESFSKCPSDSIDYAIMEKTTKAIVVALDAGWSDLGAWDAIWEQAEKDPQGNASTGDVYLEGVSNSYIHAGSRLVSVLGIEDAIIIETADSVLVSNKNSSQEVKSIVQKLKQQGRLEADEHTLVHRPWGSYESLAKGDYFQVKRIILSSGGSLSLQLHHHRAEHWAVVSGTAKVTNGDQVIFLEAGQSTYIPAEVKHRLENLGDEPVILIEVQCGTYLGEDDIERFEDIYGRSN